MQGMTSLPHIEDLPIQTLLDSFNRGWTISEKLDGSSLEFGLDEEGRFFSKRKGAPPCYSLAEWPDECWAQTYHHAHHCSMMLVSELISLGLIEKGNTFGAEIIQGELPNSVPYHTWEHSRFKIVITYSNFMVSRETEKLIKTFRTNLLPKTQVSLDGRTLSEINNPTICGFAVNQKVNENRTSELNDTITAAYQLLISFSQRMSNVDEFTYQDILEASLARTHPKTNGRKWSELKEQIKTERIVIKTHYHNVIKSIKERIAHQVITNHHLRYINLGHSSWYSLHEGMVVESSGLKFKMNNPRFAELNKFTHLVKYWIVGGRRPNRPSFLSRTKDWPKAKRLERLDVLLERYKASRHKLVLNPNMFDLSEANRISYLHEDLHQRTLNMFYDTRKRIEDGR
jgi:hypothetical protein